jgi:hypothetical protein
MNPIQPSAGRGLSAMLSLSRELLQTLLKTDQTLTPQVRSVLTDLADGKGLPDSIGRSEDRLIGVLEAAKLLNIGRSTFFEERHHHVELTPVRIGGRVSYSYQEIQHLIARLLNTKTAGLAKEGNRRVA